MGTQDARFSNQIFRYDNPIILACRRDQAVFIGVRIPYDATGYLPGQVLAYNPTDGLYYKYSASLPSDQGGGAVSGTLTASVVLFDQANQDQQLADGSGLAGVSGASLVRALAGAVVYTANLIDYTSQAKSQLGGKDRVDAGGVGLTRFY